MKINGTLRAAFAVLTVALSGCASTQLPGADQNYDPSASARIRLFGQNGMPTVMKVQTDQKANGGEIEINVGGSLGDAFGSLMGTVSNQSIGIPETENTQNLKEMNGILSKAFYREFVIPAGKQVKVRNAFIGLSATSYASVGNMNMTHYQKSCNGESVKFTPQAGKDYEVGSYLQGRSCFVMVFEIRSDAGRTTLAPVQLDK